MSTSRRDWRRGFADSCSRPRLRPSYWPRSAPSGPVTSCCLRRRRGSQDPPRRRRSDRHLPGRRVLGVPHRSPRLALAVLEQTTAQSPARRSSRSPRVDARASLWWAAPTLVAAALAAAYVIISPSSVDLAAHLFRAEMFKREGFAVWNTYWYSGNAVLGYSVLFPAVSATLTPQFAAALATTGTATGFTVIARRHFGRGGWG